MSKNKARLKKLEERIGSNVDPIVEIIVNVTAMDGSVEKTFIVKDGLIVK